MQKRLENSLILIWTVSLVATLGSLYFSVVRGFEPCTLCWYQRILMYPIILDFRCGDFPKKRTNCINNSCFCIHWWRYFLVSLRPPKTELS